MSQRLFLNPSLADLVDFSESLRAILKLHAMDSSDPCGKLGD